MQFIIWKLSLANNFLTNSYKRDKKDIYQAQVKKEEGCSLSIIHLFYQLLA